MDKICTKLLLLLDNVKTQT